MHCLGSPCILLGLWSMRSPGHLLSLQDFMLHALLDICFAHHRYEHIKSLLKLLQSFITIFLHQKGTFGSKITYKTSLILLICGHNTHLAGSVKIAFSVK